MQEGQTQRYYEVLKNVSLHHKNGKLCERGFYITDSDENLLPAQFHTWKVTRINGLVFYVHPDQTLYTAISKGKLYFLIGHAYNPFTGEIHEQKILQELIFAEEQGKQAYLDSINSLTGVFLFGILENRVVTILLDCAGMMGGFYGIVDHKLVITSHSVIPAMVFSLKRTEYVRDLLNYKFYSLYGNFLPGDITPYDELKRVVPNTMVSISIDSEKSSIQRFFPCETLRKVGSEKEYRDQITVIADVMERTMELIAKKWNRPAISLTGGMDSKTTLSAAKKHYPLYRYFSYITSLAEKVDAEAAHRICDFLNLKHTIYDISVDPDRYGEFELVRSILEFNADYLGGLNKNEVCKRIYFSEKCDFDIEVKSWVSEIARANYYKKFGKKKMPAQITPRRCSSMYKIFLHNRKLLHQTDGIFAEYIEKTELLDHLYNFDWSDLFLWEIRYGSWGGLVITSEHKYSFDITIPYNNRKLLQLMLAVPLEKRRKDCLHRDLIAHMNSLVDVPGITITNLNETKIREFCEKCYFNINSYLPF